MMHQLTKEGTVIVIMSPEEFATNIVIDKQLIKDVIDFAPPSPRKDELLGLFDTYQAMNQTINSYINK